MASISNIRAWINELKEGDKDAIVKALEEIVRVLQDLEDRTQTLED